MYFAKRKYLVFFLLTVLFLAPSICAYWCFLNPHLLSGKAVNKGKLLVKPIKLSPQLVVDRKFLPKTLINLDPKTTIWRVVYIEKNSCKEHCLKQLELLAKVRIALGRKYYSTEIWLIQPKLKDSNLLTNFLEMHSIKLGRLNQESFNNLESKVLNEQKLFIADPNFYLILGYPLLNPKDLFRDLQRLIS